MKKILMALMLCLVSVAVFTGCKDYKYKELESSIDSAFKYKDLPLNETSLERKPLKVCFSQRVLSDDKHFIVECDGESVIVYLKDEDSNFYINDVGKEIRDYGYKDAVWFSDIIVIPCK